MIFDGEKNKWLASTRNGSNLEFDKHELVDAFEARQTPGNRVIVKDSDSYVVQAQG